MDITIKYPSHNDLVQWYYQLAQSIAESQGVTPEQVNDLIVAYISEHPYPVVPNDIITQANAAANVVTSVNGEKGDVTVSSGGGDVPENVVTSDNIAQNAVTSFNGAKGEVRGVTSVNGQTGEVTIPAPPDNVITSDNISQNAVTSFNGSVGAVSGVRSVNMVTGPDVELGHYSSDGIYVIPVSNTWALLVTDIRMQCVSQIPPRYAGVLLKAGYKTVAHIISVQFLNDVSPFVPSYAALDTSEGVWTIECGGIASGQQVTIGDQKYAAVMALVVR